jgi:hypothetical protein
MGYTSTVRKCIQIGFRIRQNEQYFIDQSFEVSDRLRMSQASSISDTCLMSLTVVYRLSIRDYRQNILNDVISITLVLTDVSRHMHMYASRKGSRTYLFIHETLGARSIWLIIKNISIDYKESLAKTNLPISLLKKIGGIVICSYKKRV